MSPYDTVLSSGDWTTSNIICYNTVGSSDSITISRGSPPKPKAESALEWLDRRVDEMRVRL